jgi:hypothetical protein
MKRDGSRFSAEELNIVINNWELIAKENNGSFKIRKDTIDLRPLASQILNKNNIDHLEFVLCQLYIHIPFMGSHILIKTNETKPPIFEYLVKNNRFSFSIRNEDLFDKFAKMFGMNELQIGDSSFDKKYFIETDDNRFVQTFLDDKIRNWLNENQIAYFDLNSQKSKNKLSLYFIFDELNIEHIKHQIEIFQYCIEKINNATYPYGMVSSGLQ